MQGRKLATIQRIEEVIPILNEDKIVTYRTGVSKVIDTKGKYKVGDLIVYLEADSWIPHRITPFLSKVEESMVNKGVPGECLCNIKINSKTSQGLLLKIDHGMMLDFDYGDSLKIGMDVSDYLGIVKC